MHYRNHNENIRMRHETNKGLSYIRHFFQYLSAHSSSKTPILKLSSQCPSIQFPRRFLPSSLNPLHQPISCHSTAQIINNKFAAHFLVDCNGASISLQHTQRDALETQRSKRVVYYERRCLRPISLPPKLRKHRDAEYPIPILDRLYPFNTALSHKLPRFLMHDGEPDG